MLIIESKEFLKPVKWSGLTVGHFDELSRIFIINKDNVFNAYFEKVRTDPGEPLNVHKYKGHYYHIPYPNKPDLSLSTKINPICSY